jgi:hypothetical protein
MCGTPVDVDGMPGIALPHVLLLCSRHEPALAPPADRRMLLLACCYLLRECYCTSVMMPCVRACVAWPKGGAADLSVRRAVCRPSLSPCPYPNPSPSIQCARPGTRPQQRQCWQHRSVSSTIPTAGRLDSAHALADYGGEHVTMMRDDVIWRSRELARTPHPFRNEQDGARAWL